MQEDYPALRILEPARTKLVAIDTQRLMWVVDECIAHHELVTSLLLVLFQKKNDRLFETFKKTVGLQLAVALEDFKLEFVVYKVLN